MSKAINLLPPELLPRRRGLSKTGFLTLVLVLLAGLYLAFSGYMWFSARRVDWIERQLALLEPQVRRVAAYEQQIKLWQEKERELQRLLKETRRWGPIITAINGAMSPGAELIRLEENEVQGRLIIEGRSTSLEAVGVVLKKLQQGSFWQAVELQEVKGNEAYLNFTIEAIFKGAKNAGAMGEKVE